MLTDIIRSALFKLYICNFLKYHIINELQYYELHLFQFSEIMFESKYFYDKISNISYAFNFEKLLLSYEIEF